MLRTGSFAKRSSRGLYGGERGYLLQEYAVQTGPRERSGSSFSRDIYSFREGRCRPWDAASGRRGPRDFDQNDLIRDRFEHWAQEWRIVSNNTVFNLLWHFQGTWRDGGLAKDQFDPFAGSIQILECRQSSVRAQGEDPIF